MIIITGDLHGTNEIEKLFPKNFPLGQKLTKKDYVIICGDFGLPFTNPNYYYYEEEMRVLKWLTDCPWTTLFVDGNHENFDFLDSLPTVQEFGSTVGLLTNSVFHLKRGHIYNIDNKTFLTMGGALSIDKERRIRDQQRPNNIKLWWEQEYWTREEEDFCVTNLASHGGKVDYIISHTIPQSVIEESEILSFCGDKILDYTSRFFEFIYRHELKSFDKWFFGHFHKNIVYDKFYGLFDEKIDLTGEKI